MRYVRTLVASTRYLKESGFLEKKKNFLLKRIISLVLEIMIIISADNDLIINFFSTFQGFFHTFLLKKMYC